MLGVLSVLAGLSEGLGITLVIPFFTQMDFIQISPSDFAGLNLFFDFFQIPLTFWILATMMLGLFAVKGGLKFVETALGFFIQSWLAQRLRNQFIAAYAGMDYQYYTAKPSGYFTHLVTSEVTRVQDAFAKFITAVSCVAIASPYIAIAFFLHWRATVLVILLGGLLYLPLAFVMTRSRRASLKVSHTNETMHSFLIQTLQAFKYLRSTSRFAPLQQRINETAQTLSRLEFRMGLGTALFHAVKEPIALILIISILSWQVYFAEEAVLPIVAVLLLIYRAVVALTHFQFEWQLFMKSVGAVKVITQALQHIQQHQEPDGEQVVGELKHQIQLEGVSLRFGEQHILRNLHLHIPAKQTIALVGESGSGKSTLVDVITGLLRPTAGKITLDGIPYTQINLRQWREHIGYVTQEVVMFDDTIANNLSLWADPSEATFKNLEHSAKAALAAPFIAAMPHQYESLVGDRGVKLSGGQRQRISIARELFKEPQLLILDEATSALDSDSERSIQQSIEKLKGKVTILIIAHRLSTLRNADVIYVLQNGSIVEQGPFAELLQREGSYFQRMCHAQNL